MGFVVLAHRGMETASGFVESSCDGYHCLSNIGAVLDGHRSEREEDARESLVPVYLEQQNQA